MRMLDKVKAMEMVARGVDLCAERRSESLVQRRACFSSTSIRVLFAFGGKRVVSRRFVDEFLVSRLRRSCSQSQLDLQKSK